MDKKFPRLDETATSNNHVTGGNQEIISQPQAQPQLLVENAPFQLVTNHENPTIFSFPSFTSTFSSGISVPIEDIPNNFATGNNSQLLSQQPNGSNSQRSLIPFHGVLHQPFENHVQTNPGPSIDELSNLIRSQHLSPPQNQPPTNVFPTSPPISTNFITNLDTSFQSPNPQPTTTSPPFSLESFLSKTPSTENQNSLPPSFFSGSPTLSELISSSPPNTRQNEIFPFDPTFSGPPTPTRYQPAVGASCISFTGERGERSIAGRAWQKHISCPNASILFYFLIRKFGYEWFFWDALFIQISL